MEQITRAAHLCVDMQNIFAKGGLWETPWTRLHEQIDVVRAEGLFELWRAADA